MALRQFTRGFYRSGFRGWMRGPLFRHIPKPKPGTVTGKAVILGLSAEAKALSFDFAVQALRVPGQAEALSIDIAVKALTIQGEAVI